MNLMNLMAKWWFWWAGHEVPDLGGLVRLLEVIRWYWARVGPLSGRPCAAWSELVYEQVALNILKLKIVKTPFLIGEAAGKSTLKCR